MQAIPNAVKFSASRQPANPGRTPTAWMRKILSEKGEEGREHRERVFRHLIEVATSWEIIVKGRDGDGRVVEVASARDAVEAGKLILGYDVGLPKKIEAPITVPEGMSTEGRSLLEIVATIYRHRLVSGEMGEDEFRGMVKELLSVDQTKLRLVLALLGKGASGKTPEEVARMVAGVEALPTVSSVVTPDDLSSAVQADCARADKADQASPNGCDTASHAPVEIGTGNPPGSAAPSDAGLLAGDDE